MLKLKTFAVKMPVLFSLLAILLGSLLTEIPLQKFFTEYMGAQPAFYLTLILEQGLVGAFFFFLLARFGWLNAAGFTSLRQWRALWLGWPLVLFALINVPEHIVIDISKSILITLHLLTALSTGWVEEVLFRGTVLTTLLQKWG